MLQIEPWKKVLILLTVLAGVLFAAPNMLGQDTRDSLPGWMPNEAVNLGLDLQGGAHVLVEAEMPPVFAAKIEETAERMRTLLREGGVTRRGRPEIEGDTVSVRIPRAEEVELARAALSRIPQPLQSVAITGVGANDYELVYDETTQTFALTFTEPAKVELTDQVLLRALDVIRRRIDPEGIKEPTIARQGEDRILIQVPGEGSADEIIRLINEPAVLSFHPVSQKYGQEDLRQGRVEAGYKIADSADTDFPDQKWAITRVPLIEGEDIADAGPGFDQNGEPVVTFRMNARAGAEWGDWTLNNVGELFAIVVDGKVISAPVIREAILGGSGQISGNFTVESATTLSLQIASGALPAKLKPLEQRTVGPELGADSVAAGEIACLVGFIAVMIFMTVVYGKFGLFANVALIANVAMILGVLSALGATLTLPGIAGIVLTIGMAVDANVLIFERIREELENGRRAATAIQTGYEKALTAIIDANITTLIAAMILYVIGSGPVKGFAVTLGIGIVTSVFTALFLTRVFVVQWFDWSRPKTFKITLWEMVKNGTKIGFMTPRNIVAVVSAVAVVASLGLFAVKGLNYGIDFKGGTLIEARTGDQPADLGAIRGVLEQMDLGDIAVQGFGAENDVLIRVEDVKGGDEARIALVGKVEAALEEALPAYETRRVESVGPKVSGELVTAGIMAVLLAIGSVLVYIWLRFEWQFSVGAVVALAHDVILTIGIFSLLSLEFNLSIIAAILTIVGYSLNDTVVVFDRVRENLRKFKRMELIELLDLSLNETLSRTLMTSITTLLALLALYFLGGPVLQGFTFAMIWGIVIGTYSSVYVASPVLNYLGVKRDWSKPNPDDLPAGVQFGGGETK